MPKSLYAYTLFHLNLAYSSIEESSHQEVITRCYWPLLNLARELELPFGIEASGYTLEKIKELDPAWIKELIELITSGPCEFIGSGYAQIIGPLVPAEVNAANLRIGDQFYKKILGIKPTTALINEQAYSAGMVEHYLKAEYDAIIMEWDNPARFHPEWPPSWSYLPQLACNQSGQQIPVIWNKSISFQKFQRYVYKEMELNEYISYLSKHLADISRMLPIYCNDVEIFNFRPGRYSTEPTLNTTDEWDRIRHLFETLKSDHRFNLIRPSQVLELINEADGGNSIYLESPEQPIPVKKQGKYNVTRWAVTGRDDLKINTACQRILRILLTLPNNDDSDWQELCYLWSSDFRTHITENRWQDYKQRLADFEGRLQIRSDHEKTADTTAQMIKCHNNIQTVIPQDVQIDLQGHFLHIETNSIRIILNCRRGLAIDRLWFKQVSDNWLCGTLPHGYYDDINWGADYYSGHLVFEAPGQHKVTDLNPVEPKIYYKIAGPEEGKLVIPGKIETPLGPIHKELILFKDIARVDMFYQLAWPIVATGSLRLGHITLNPEAFSKDSLLYATHNGGEYLETFRVNNQRTTQGDPVSFLVSAQTGLGLTKGEIRLGDLRQQICIKYSQDLASTIGMITYRQVGPSYFYRLAFSGGEMDETNCDISKSEISSNRKQIYQISILPFAGQ